MAEFQGIFPPAKERSTQLAVAATTSSADIVIGSSSSETIFVITASGAITIRFGNATNIGNADATDWPIASGAVQEFALPTGCDRFRVFNTGAASVNVNYWGLAKN